MKDFPIKQLIKELEVHLAKMKRQDEFIEVVCGFQEAIDFVKEFYNKKEGE